MFVAIDQDRITFRSCIRESVEAHIAEHGGLLYVLLYDEPSESDGDSSEECKTQLENEVLR